MRSLNLPGLSANSNKSLNLQWSISVDKVNSGSSGNLRKSECYTELSWISILRSTDLDTKYYYRRLLRILLGELPSLPYILSAINYLKLARSSAKSLSSFMSLEPSRSISSTLGSRLSVSIKLPYLALLAFPWILCLIYIFVRIPTRTSSSVVPTPLNSCSRSTGATSVVFVLRKSDLKLDFVSLSNYTVSLLYRSWAITTMSSLDVVSVVFAGKGFRLDRAKNDCPVLLGKPDINDCSEPFGSRGLRWTD